jgi:hypothetical protein
MEEGEGGSGGEEGWSEEEGAGGWRRRRRRAEEGVRGQRDDREVPTEKAEVISSWLSKRESRYLAETLTPICFSCDFKLRSTKIAPTPASLIISFT